MKIAFVFDDGFTRPSGIGTYVTELAAELARRGHDVEHLVGAGRQQSLKGVPVRALARNVGVSGNGSRASMPLFVAPRALRECRVRSFDVIHVQVPFSPLLGGRILRLAHPRAAAIGTAHVASDRPFSTLGGRVLRGLTRGSLGRLDRLIAVSSSAREYAWRALGVASDAIVPVGLDLPSRSRSRPLKSADVPSVAFVGQISRRKGLSLLVHALAMMERKVHLDVVGDGPQRRRAERLASELGLEATFHGLLSEAAKLDVLSRSTVTCCPSIYGESLGVVLLEAIATTGPVAVGGNAQGHRDLLRDSRATIDRPEASMLAERLEALLRDAGLRRAIRAAQQAEIARYDVRAVADVTEAIYTDALGHRRSCSSNR